MNKNPNARSRANLRPFKPQPEWKGNAGGAPKGKKVSTWMAELGQMTSLPSASSLPINGQIALARIKQSLNQKYGDRACEIVIEKVEGKQTQPIAFVPGVTKEAALEWARKHT